MEFGPIVATTAVSNLWTVMGKLGVGPRSACHLVEKKLRVQLDAEAQAQPSRALGTKDSRRKIRRKKESADKPGSVVDNHSSAIRVAAYLQRPTREHMRAACAVQPRGLGRLPPYLVLLRAGFAVPPSVATGAVRSYRTISPLPARGRSHALRRFAFCCTFRGLAPPRRYLAPCPGSPDFPPPWRAAVVWPTPNWIIQVIRSDY